MTVWIDVVVFAACLQMAFLARCLNMIKIEPIKAEHNADVQTVVSTFFSKFPHPSTPELLQVEVLDDTRDKPNVGQHFRRRRYHITNTAGWPLSSILGWSVVIFEEQSIWDEARQTLFMKS